MLLQPYIIFFYLMKLIILSFFTKKHLFPFFMGMNYFALELSTLISRNWPVVSSGGGINYFNHHPFFMTWLLFLSKIPCIFVYLIQSKLSRDDYTSQGLTKPLNTKNLKSSKRLSTKHDTSKIVVMLWIIAISAFEGVSSVILSTGIIVTCSYDKTIKFWTIGLDLSFINLATNEFKEGFSCVKEISKEKLLSGSINGRVALWSLKTYSLIKIYDIQLDFVFCIETIKVYDDNIALCLVSVPEAIEFWVFNTNN